MEQLHQWPRASLLRGEAPPTGQNTVHVWKWTFEEEWLEADASVLSPEELARLRQFHFEPDRRRYLASHYLQRLILGAYLKTSPRDLVFTATQAGKPALLSPRHSIHFNLSHSHTTGLLALSYDTVVGVDVEDIHTVPADLPGHHFSIREQRDLAQVAQEAWLQSFFNCWTRKEAILKAEGLGLNIPLSSFDVSLRLGDAAQLLEFRPESQLSRHWHLRHLALGTHIVGALATERHFLIHFYTLV